MKKIYSKINILVLRGSLVAFFLVVFFTQSIGSTLSAQYAYADEGGVGSSVFVYIDEGGVGSSNYEPWPDIDYGAYTEGGIGSSYGSVQSVTSNTSGAAVSYEYIVQYENSPYAYSYAPTTYSYNPTTYGSYQYSYAPTNYSYNPTTYSDRSSTYSTYDYSYDPKIYNDYGDVRCDIDASDTRVEKGDRITLDWNTTNADDVRINQGIGDVSDDGSRRVTITKDTTFTLTARNGSDTRTCRVQVRVDDDSDDIPRCRLTISDTRIQVGEQVTLSWDNLRTDRLVLRDSHGITIADSKYDRTLDEDAGALFLRPTRQTDYVATVYNGNERRTCTVGVQTDNVVITSVRSQGGIPLAGVPYTGFEAGPALTTFFYLVLIIWGVIIAYVLVIRKKVLVNEPDVLDVYTKMTETNMPEISVDMYEQSLATPSNLPIDTDESQDDEDSPLLDETFQALEGYAHEHKTLVSSEALRFIESQGGTMEAQVATLDHVIKLAKARYPIENGWTVLNKDRVITLLE
ncbi:MAG: hypothetical protein K9M10_00785 [Candidatus Pacebacteria bacterium]|nr:hypothetical protein [Candidatus Paceibacterota bacterium]MCF7856998.1 hypothetical protein [Candidatus Paceibacterota bacterium]